MTKNRWVIVAQLTGSAHQPSVYGTWQTREAAEEQLARWERRIERTFGRDPGTAIALSVERMEGKTADRFELDFLCATGKELAR